MRQKNLVQLFLIVSLLCISPLPLINLFFLYRQDALSLENLTKQKLFTTDHLESDLNYFAYRHFDYSFLPQKTVVGKDGYLFLGNHYARVIDKAEGKFPYTQKDIEKWADGLKAVEKWFEKRGIVFLFVIAPNKSSIYPEKLPDAIVYREGDTITDAIVKAAKERGVALLDLRPVLRKEKGDETLFFKTDTHWNNKGASIAFDATIRFLNAYSGHTYALPDYSLHPTRTISGDLAGFLKIKKLLSPRHELEFIYDFNKSIPVCHGIIDPENRTLKACKMVENPILNVFAEDQYMINKNAANPEKLLLIGDSFSTATSKLYNATFATLWKFHHSRLHGKNLAEFVEKNRPDIVIYQIVERDLYTPTLVEKLP